MHRPRRGGGRRSRRSPFQKLPNGRRKKRSEMRRKAVYDGYRVQLPNSANEMDDLGGLLSVRALEALVRTKAFVYEAEGGVVSVRLERKERGSEIGYWMAYKRQGGKLRKTYICEAYALDPHNLDEAAQR